MPFGGVTLTDLNNFMKNYPSGVIVPEDFTDVALYDALRSTIQRKPHAGDNVEILIQTSTPYTGKGHGEDVDIPYPDDLGFVKMEIPLREVIVNAGISKQALDRAAGGDSSWGRAVDLVLQAQRKDFLWLMEIAAIGNGTGALARVSSVSASSGVVTVTCDNTYSDFGIENVALFKKGMKIEIYASDLSTPRTLTGGASFVEITSVSFGDRRNGAPTAGSFTFAGSGSNTYSIADNDVVFLKGARSEGLGGSKYSPTGPLPMGLIGIVQGDGDSYTSPAALTTFQGLTRSAYPTLKAKVYQASDFNPSGTDGTPCDWDLSVITDAINQVETDAGAEVDLLICSSQLAMAVHRKNRAENGITVNVNATTAQNQPVLGSEIAQSFLSPTGRPIRILVSKTVPRNVLYGSLLLT